MLKKFDCVDGNMDILMYNNTTKKIKDIKVGDAIYAVKYNGFEYNFVKSEILSINKRKGKAVKITLSDGREIVSSYNHQWLTKQGWHFAYDDGTLDGKKYYLNEDIKMFGLPNNIKDIYEENENYMAGYITGAQVYGKNLVDLKCGKNAEFAFMDSRITTRIYNYLLYFDVNVQIINYFAHAKDTNEYYITNKILIPYKELIKFSKECEKYSEESDFLRGFVAGAYDSDGMENPFIKNVNNNRKNYLAVMDKGLKMFDFEYFYDSQEMTTELMGGPFELVRFYNIFKPISVCRLENIKLENKSSDNIKVVSIEEVECSELVEVITSARNFIANGIVSHNCTTGLLKED